MKGITEKQKAESGNGEGDWEGNRAEGKAETLKADPPA
jgi:hypothetical protein